MRRISIVDRFLVALMALLVVAVGVMIIVVSGEPSVYTDFVLKAQRYLYLAYICGALCIAFGIFVIFRVCGGENHAGDEDSRRVIALSQEETGTVGITQATLVSIVERTLDGISDTAVSRIFFTSGEDGSLSLDLYVFIKQDTVILEKCNEIRNAVANSVMSMTDLHLKKIDILVGCSEEK